jgi:hypothetical protein
MHTKNITKIRNIKEYKNLLVAYCAKHKFGSRPNSCIS